ncbi:DUF6268 family outer membrane beta-barrel protein [Mucilaginibacter pedocola]|uniref:Outer membrane protein beta-barrel domain-containing protein n=1 Tax=Mucilaginibacter pedocola TaxID=1792845 RepID=A0A1S9PIT7_9SPHI|nr:DUF6268 family outer membrane beta-barrel protein [Mucilaginibacter pedocola]OOQ60855.1 hypothetical protein BC343_23095 [Mucilaginibacter pedocola]
MKKTLFTMSALCLMSAMAFAQTAPNAARQKMIDSIRNAAIAEAAKANPMLRQLHISTDIISQGDINGKLYGDPLFKGRASTIRTNMAFNIPLKTWGKNSLSASLNYFQQRIEITDVESFNPIVGNEDRIFNKSTVGFSAAFQRRDSLFGRPVFLMASVLGVTNEASSIKRLSYLGTAIFPLKQTAKTRYSVGLIINIDPSLKVPVVPFFTYWHKFDNDIELNVNLPRQLGLRKAFSDNFWGTFGTSLSGSVAFFNINNPTLPNDVNYTTIDLKTGPGIEYRFAKKFIFGVSGGILTPLSSRVFDRNKTSSDYFINNKLSNVPYVNFSLSLLPFLR